MKNPRHVCFTYLAVLIDFEVRNWSAGEEISEEKPDTGKKNLLDSELRLWKNLTKISKFNSQDIITSLGSVLGS